MRPFFFYLLAALAPLSSRAVDIVPPPDPIAAAPEALATARASLRPVGKKGGIKATEAYAAILQLRQAAEAYNQKGDAKQASLYYQETLRSLQALAKAAPSFQKEDVAAQTQELQAAISALPAPAVAEKTLQIELTRASLQDGHLKVEWKLHPPDMTASEIERHLTFTIAMKLSDGTTVKKPKTVESLFLPSPTGEPNIYIASQDYICPSNVKSVLLGVEFFDVSIFQQNQVVPIP